MSRTMPPMLQVLKDIGGIDIPDTLAGIAGVTPPAKESNGSVAEIKETTKKDDVKLATPRQTKPDEPQGTSEA